MDAPENGPELFLHCLVPPVRLISGAVWQLIQQEDVPNYGLLEEFVSLVTDSVPDLLSYQQKIQLTLGLRARLVLEMCGKEIPADPEIIQTHLRTIQNLLTLYKELESSDTQVEECGTNFLALVQILIKDPAERSIFFKEVFPWQYGVMFNTALKKLMWLFLSRLENALPQPTMEETAQMLSKAPTIMEECIQYISQPQQLRNVFKYQRPASVDISEQTQSWSNTPDDYVLSCLGSLQLLQVVTEEQTHVNTQSEPVLDFPPTYCQEVQVESVVIAQYIDNDLESKSNICEGNVDGMHRFDADPKKVYEVQNLDHIGAEDAAAVVYEEVETVDLRTIGFVLDVSPEKQDALKNKDVVEGLETVNSTPEIPACQENNKMAMDGAMKTKPQCAKMDLTQERTGDKSDHISVSTEVSVKSDDIQQESNELFGLVKQSCVKLNTFLQPAQHKRGRGRPRKDIQNKKPRKDKKQDCSLADPFASLDQPSEIRNVASNVDQKLKKIYEEVKGSPVMYACSLCTFQHSEEIQLQHHLTLHHTDEYKHLCEPEDEEEKAVQINTPHDSETHGKPLTKIRLYRGVPVCRTCPICGKTFTRSSDMRRHQTLHTVVRPFTCLSCRKTFRYSFDLRRHQLNSCANQGYVVLTQSKMDEDTENDSEASAVSNNEKMLPSSPVKQQSRSKQDAAFCRVCRITLSNTISLEKHMETHSKGIHQICPCGKTYKCLRNMRTHQLVCLASELPKHEQKQWDAHSTVKVVLPDYHSQDLPNPVSDEPGMKNTVATSNASSVISPVSDSSDQIQVPLKPGESSQMPDAETSAPTTRSRSISFSSDTRRSLRAPSAAYPHKCSLCGDSFKYSYNLKKHEDICEGKNRSKEHSMSFIVSSNCKTTELAANISKEPVLKESQSTEHKEEEEHEEWQEHKATSIKTKVPETVFTCDKCEKKYEDPHALKKHKKICGIKEQHYKCIKCASMFRTLHEVRKHVHTHWGEDPLQCTHCGKYFQNASELSKHRVVHERERNYPCTLCLDTFERLDSLRQHYLEVHECKGPYQCPHCDKTHVDLGSMVVHVRTHNDERPYRCALCPKRFKHRSGLNVHEKLHSGDRPFLCEECGKCFSSNIQLQRHSVSHSNERPYTCSECKKSFKSHQALRGHLMKHSKPANVPCEYCGKVFSQISALDRHHRTHTGERPFSCPKCSKTFLTSGEVRKHLRYHTGERPFQCTLCSKSFTQTCYLTAHMRTHTGERPYVCCICAKGFVCNTHLKRHMFVHTKEKPFKCDCGKAFNRTNLLRIHQKTQCFLQEK